MSKEKLKCWNCGGTVFEEKLHYLICQQCGSTTVPMVETGHVAAVLKDNKATGKPDYSPYGMK